MVKQKTAKRCVLAHFLHFYPTFYSFFAIFPCLKKTGDGQTNGWMDRWMEDALVVLSTKLVNMIQKYMLDMGPIRHNYTYII